MKVEKREKIIWELEGIIKQTWLQAFDAKSFDNFISIYKKKVNSIRSSVKYKAGSEPVTFWDKKINGELLNNFKEILPDYKIISEELPEKDTTRNNYQEIIIDPIDGTSNFVKGIGHFCTAIAIKDASNTVLLGAVYNPIKNEFFYSIGKNKSFYNGTEISVNKEILKRGLLLISDGSSDKSGNKEIIKRVKTLGIGYKILGAANLDLCEVARGTAIGYLKTKAPEWDYLAGKFIIENAGGRCEVEKGNVIASNGRDDVHNILKNLFA
jgi:myo-inositol-1(or 4)-monophosphatase